MHQGHQSKTPCIGLHPRLAVGCLPDRKGTLWHHHFEPTTSAVCCGRRNCCRRELTSRPGESPKRSSTQPKIQRSRKLWSCNVRSESMFSPTGSTAVRRGVTPC